MLLLLHLVELAVQIPPLSRLVQPQKTLFSLNLNEILHFLACLQNRVFELALPHHQLHVEAPAVLIELRPASLHEVHLLAQLGPNVRTYQ